MTATKTDHEWNAATAAAYWPDQRGHWAPVSWKDHLYDFSVFYNGAILANPAGIGMNRNIPPEDQIFASELRVKLLGHNPAPGETKEAMVAAPHSGVDIGLIQLMSPDGRHVASWESRAAPVYVIEHAPLRMPLLVKQRQFAHTPGGRAVERGNEPHFLWVRLEVSDIIEEVCALERVYATLTVLAPSILTGMGAFNNINFNYGYGVPAYPMPLTFEGTADLSTPGYLRHAMPLRMFGSYHNGRRNRLAVPAGQPDVQAVYLQSDFFSAVNQSVGHLVLSMPCTVGAHVDFVYPIIPVDDETLEQELALGYDGALAETERFWQGELKTSTSIQVSEPLLQGWVDNLPRLTAMIAQKHPASGTFGLPSGTYNYEAIWPTPMAMQAYGLEMLGFSREVDKYLEPFRLNQGINDPPSKCLPQHPGFIGAPKELTGIDWITDHAAILWAATHHAAMTMDPDFLERWTPAIVKACQFTVDARQATGHSGYPGILPPAVSNDSGWMSQTGWNNAWHHKALKTAAAFLAKIGHPEADRFRAEAEDYRDTFCRAFREVAARSKTWRAPDGTELPFVPAVLAEATGQEAAHPFYLDTGPLVLVFGELLDASDPLMQASLRWFREGPQWRIYRHFSSEFQTSVLDHEVSSCEPCYSWNVFHSYQLGDREQFTQGLYGVFAAGASRQNFVACETRDAVFGNVFTHGLALMLMRMAVIDEEGDDLHLLRMAPQAFFKDGGFDWRNVPTWFGDLSIAGRYDGDTLHITYQPPARETPKRTLLHLPPLEAKQVLINGKPCPRLSGILES